MAVGRPAFRRATPAETLAAISAEEPVPLPAVAKDNFLLLTIGATVSISHRVAICGTVVRTLWGQNTHKVAGGTLGLSLSFGGGLGLGRQ